MSSVDLDLREPRCGVSISLSLSNVGHPRPGTPFDPPPPRPRRAPRQTHVAESRADRNSGIAEIDRLPIVPRSSPDHPPIAPTRHREDARGSSGALSGTHGNASRGGGGHAGRKIRSRGMLGSSRDVGIKENTGGGWGVPHGLQPLILYHRAGDGLTESHLHQCHSARKRWPLSLY